jgi:hypothetical protein
MFWGNASDYYFGPRSAVSALKISLHKNGIGYLGFDKKYHAALQNDSIYLARTSHQWKLPQAEGDAVPVASILLPAASFGQAAFESNKTIELGVSDEELAAQITIYYSRGGDAEEIDKQLVESGTPMLQTVLDDGRIFYIVAGQTTYDPTIIPSGPLQNGTQTLLDKNALTASAEDYEHLNAMMWNKPPDGGMLRIIDVGGVKIHRMEEQPSTT